MSATTIDYGTLGERAAAGLKPKALSDEQKIARAKEAFLAGIDADMATYLESCIHCGMCAEACHFYISTGEAKYTPIFKLEPLKKVYRRELAPTRWLNRLTTRDITAGELEDWKELAYDSCTQCGRCSLLCPMGIHIQSMIQVVRSGLAAAGLAPAELQAVSDEQKDKATILGAGPDKLREVVERVRAKGIEVPLDKDKAEVLVLSSALDFLKDDSILAATAKIMNKVGANWTIRSDGFESANFGALRRHAGAAAHQQARHRGGSRHAARRRSSSPSAAMPTRCCAGRPPRCTARSCPSSSSPWPSTSARSSRPAG
jgi:Fe-S oxidoreductase